jgi:thermosome
MMGTQPVIILKEGTRREKGKGAQENNTMAARAIADAVRTTLGPKGMDKMLVDSMGDVTITNDGVTILKEIDVEHPAAKMIIEVAKTQDQECYDGTTTAVVISGELLKNASELLSQNVHPTIITEGYRLASEKASDVLGNLALKITKEDKSVLKSLAITAMSGKSASGFKDYLSDLCIDAVMAVMDEEDGKLVGDIDNIKTEKKQGGSVDDTELIQGIIIDKERVHPGMPKRIKNAKVALLDAALEVKKTEVDARINITDPTQLQAFLDEEEKMLRNMVEKVKSSGANVLICQKGIDDVAQHFLAKEGIYAVRRVKKSDMEKLVRATGSNMVTSLDDLTPEDLGKAGVVEERKIGDDEMTFVMDCANPKAVSILIRGGSEHVVDEVERSIHDGLGVLIVALEDGKAVPGGGASEIEVALALRRYASTVGGREQLAIEAFAGSMDVIPRTLAENAGLDPINTLVDLRSTHESGNKTFGLDANNGKVVDMVSSGVIEPLRVKTQAIRSAAEVANMIMRIDDVIASKATAPPTPPGGAGGGPGGMGEEEF